MVNYILNMTNGAFVFLFVVLTLSLVGFIFIQYLYYLNSKDQNNMYSVNNQPLCESDFQNHIRTYDKSISQITSRNHIMGFVFIVISFILIIVGFIYLVLPPEMSSLEMCTVFICLTVITCMIILSGILYHLHSEQISFERDLGYKMYSIERKMADRPSKDKDISKLHSDVSQSGALRFHSEK